MLYRKFARGKFGVGQGKSRKKTEFEKTICVVTCYLTPGFMQRLENLENQNGHRKVMEHEILAKIMEF